MSTSNGAPSPGSGEARTDAVIVLTTIGADADAAALARTLVDEHLVACVSILPPMTSIYRWNGQVEEAGEQQLVMKTVSGRVAVLHARLRSLHPYELPEFLVIAAADVSDDYLSWLRAATG